MPTDQLMGLFGPSAYDVEQARNKQALDYAVQMANMNNIQQAKMGIGQGAAGIARAGAGMFGLVDPKVEEAKRTQAIMAQGGDLTTSKGLKEKAAQFAQAGDQTTALKLMLLARKQEQEEAKMLMEAQKQKLLERRQAFQEQDAMDLKWATLEAKIESEKRAAEQQGISAAERARHNRAIEDLQAQQLALRREMKDAGGKAPTGYRFTADGNLEAIPGGPADAKARAKEEAQAVGVTDVEVAVSGLRDAYDRLEKGGGITSTKKEGIANVPAAIASSSVGQMAGKVFGTANQSARNEIAMTRPALLAAIMKATGMSAKQMDSNAELRLWIATATDPQLDVEANRKALNNIERKYLSGNKSMPKQSGKVNFGDLK